MLSPEEIVSVVKKQKAGERIDPLPALRFDYSARIPTIQASVELTLAYLNDCSTPFVGAEVVPRSINTTSRGGNDRSVETAAWSILLLDEKPDHNEGGTVQIQFVMDAFGDLLARSITVSPDKSIRICRLKKWEERSLRRPLVSDILCGLEDFRDTLEERFLPRQPSLV